MGIKRMTKKSKVEIAANAPEIIAAVSLLIALFKDCKMNSHIRYVFNTQDKESFEITFLQIKNTLKPTQP